MSRDPWEAQRELLQIQQSYEGCTKCHLHEERTGIIYGPWSGIKQTAQLRTHLMFVSDRHSLGALDTFKAGLGDSEYGGILLSLAEQMPDLDTESCWFTSLTLCPTALVFHGQWPPVEIMPIAKKAAMDACRARLHAEVLAVNPEVIVAFGNASVKALWPKVPPKFLTSIGELREVQIPGKLVSRTFPVMVTNSLSDLYRNGDDSNGGVWERTYTHLAIANSVASYMRSTRAASPGSNSE